MRRLEAIRQLAAEWTDELIVATTGMISRELYVVRDRAENFYMCGSMGCALPIGLGLSLAHPERKVVVLDGDGAALMSLGSLALARHLRLPNLVHIILDNATYASTGDQPTCSAALNFEEVGFQVRHLRVEPGNQPDTPRIPYDPLEMRRRFERAVRRSA
ncbi:thiamine pyrophosphate-dependent enzyme [Acidobacteriia bacterium AH_259_A11_L15]|nr:thiamine pyrophosphate-dependent enzyme [Acidobacteriia bacterium AH_259_A11_L15]